MVAILLLPEGFPTSDRGIGENMMGPYSSQQPLPEQTKMGDNGNINPTTFERSHIPHSSPNNVLSQTIVKLILGKFGQKAYGLCLF